MAQLKQVCTVTKGSQTITVIGVNVAYRIRANNIFMVVNELVPYTVAADATFDGTNTVVQLTGAYQGTSNTMAPSAFVTDFTAPDNIPLISQGDVGTAAIWTKAMYTLQDMIGSVTPAGLTAFIAEINGVMAAADTSAANAHTSENNAADSATAASQSKAAAATSAAAALSSQNAALASQNAAKTSEANAKTSETNASSSAADARTSNTQAASSRDAAAGSATAAASSASAALASQNASKTSETNAGTSAAAASGSMTAAGTSATNAKTSETNAKASESNAAASKAAAATSETNAKTSETNAAASATSAASDRSTVQGILATMNALYLGNKASEPTTDNNGNALKLGAEYFDTTKQLLRVYTSTGWQDYDKDAQTQAVNATASASAAAGSAAGAATSASNAKTSENNAKTSESNAKTSETNAKTSENNAGSSSSAAATSAANALTSENHAKTSETNAAASAAHADAVSAAIGNPVSKNGDIMTGDLLLEGAKLQSTRYGTGGGLVLRSAAGTIAAPTLLTAGMQAGVLVYRGYDGANYQDLAGIDAWSEGDVSNTSAPGNLRLYTTPIGSVTKVERARFNAAGRFLIGSATDDGVNLLQVSGGVKGVRSSGALLASSGADTQTSVMLTRDSAAANEKSWELLHGSTGAFTLRSINDTYSDSRNAIVVNRPSGNGIGLTTMNLMSGGGRVVVGSTYTDDGASALQVGGTFTAMSNANGTVGNFSPFSYAGGVAIEAYNLGNSTKKNVALSPWGGRVLVGTTTDDGSNLLQVNGSGSFAGALQTTGAITVNSAGEGNIKVGQNDGYFYGNSTGAGWYSPTKGSFAFNLSDGKFYVQGSPVWTGATFDPTTRVLKSGDSMTGPLNVAGQITTTGGALSVGGWNSNANLGVIYFGPNASNKYLYYDGTTFQFSGGALAVNGFAVWNTQNLAKPFQTTGGTITGQTDVTGTRFRMLNGTSFDLFSGGNSYSATLVAGASFVGFLNQANNAWNMQIAEGGQVSFPRARPTWAGLTPWDNGNFNPAAYQPAGSYIKNSVRNDSGGLGLQSGAPPGIAQITSSGNGGNVALTIANGGNNAASAVMTFIRDGSYAGFFGLDTDNQLKWGGYSMGAVAYRIWHEGNFNPGSYATLSAQVQWGSGISELGGVVTGADVTCDAGGPWVVQGLRTVGGSNRIYMRIVWLRNQ